MANVVTNFLGDIATNVRGNLVTSNNYGGENYGYDKIGLDKMFKGYTDPYTHIYFPPTSPGKLPANGTQYSIPTSLGGGIGTFNASDYTIRNSAGQIVGSINWSSKQPDQMGSNVIGSPRWPANRLDQAQLAHDIGFDKAKETKSTDAWLKANDDLRSSALAISTSSTSTWAEKQDALVVLAALKTGLMNPPPEWGPGSALASAAGLSISANAASKPSSVTYSSDGKTVTLVWVSKGNITTETEVYTDSTRKVIVSNTLAYKDTVTGLNTRDTINFNPGVANGSCTYTSETTSLDGKTLIQKVDSNADGKIDSVTTTTTTSNGSQIVQVDSKNSGVIDQTYVIKNGQRYNVANLKDAMQIDALIYNKQLGDFGGALLAQMERSISNFLAMCNLRLESNSS